VVSFTGSSEVGGLLSTSATASVKRLTLELGGNAPFIVFRYIERTIGRALSYLTIISQNAKKFAKCKNLAQFRELPASINTKNL
jgi:succinate-semialdehyde dehydrogenase/glutarate-semialdehyde dehydrogenase